MIPIHQLPAFSPLTLRALWKALAQGIRPSERAEGELAAYLAGRFQGPSIVLTASGTQALDLGLRLCRPPGGNPDPVAIPAYSCFDVVTAAVGAEVPVVFFDLDPVTLSPDLRSLCRALDEGARTVVVGNLFGYPVDWAGILAECRKAGAVVIEDAAQGLGSSWMGQAAGTFGDLTVLSFGRGKGWTGIGGGALIVRPEGLVVRTEEFRLEYPRKTRDSRLWIHALFQWMFGRPALYGIPAAFPGLELGETRYKEPTSIQRISSVSAALVRHTAGLGEAEVRCRRRTAAKFLEHFAARDSPGPLGAPCLPLPGGESSFLRLPILGEGTLAQVPPRLQAMGIARGYPKSLPNLQQVARIVLRTTQVFSGAEELARGLLTVPTHSKLRHQDVQRIAGFL